MPDPEGLGVVVAIEVVEEEEGIAAEAATIRASRMSLQGPLESPAEGAAKALTGRLNSQEKKHTMPSNWSSSGSTIAKTRRAV